MIEIEHWKLRVPSMSPDDGRRLARRVVSLLSERLPSEHRDWSSDQLDLELSWSPGESIEELARRIAESILDDLITQGVLS